MNWVSDTESNDVEIEATIHNRAGIHCRPTAVIVKEARRFQSDVTITAPDAQTADPKSAIELLSLGLDQGTEVRIRATGSDAQACAARMKELFETEFDFPQKT